MAESHICMDLAKEMGGLHSGLNYGLPKSRLSSPLVELHWSEPNQDSSQEKKEGLKSEYICDFSDHIKEILPQKGPPPLV